MYFMALNAKMSAQGTFAALPVRVEPVHVVTLKMRPSMAAHGRVRTRDHFLDMSLITESPLPVARWIIDDLDGQQGLTGSGAGG
jgi:hypothetical protein